MDLAVRQALLQALTHATSPAARVALRRKDGSLLLLGRDLVCYENHIEATTEDGRVLVIPYCDIEGVESGSR